MAAGGGLSGSVDGRNHHFLAKHDGVLGHVVSLSDSGGGHFVFRADAGERVTGDDGVDVAAAVAAVRGVEVAGMLGLVTAAAGEPVLSS